MAFAKKRVTVIVLAAVLLFSAVVAGDKLWAQDKKETPAAVAATAPATAGPVWAKRCDDLKEGEKVTGQYCEAVQSLSVLQKDADPSTAQRVAEIAIGYPPTNKNKPSGAVILPLGILVENKVEVEIDGEKLLSFKIRYCDASGCIGILDLDNSDIEDLRKGKEITLKSQAATGQPLVITLSLSGIAGILDQIKPKS